MCHIKDHDVVIHWAHSHIQLLSTSAHQILQHLLPPHRGHGYLLKSHRWRLDDISLRSELKVRRNEATARTSCDRKFCNFIRLGEQNFKDNAASWCEARRCHFCHNILTAFIKPTTVCHLEGFYDGTSLYF